MKGRFSKTLLKRKENVCGIKSLRDKGISRSSECRNREVENAIFEKRTIVQLHVAAEQERARL